MGVDLNGAYDQSAAPQEDFGAIPAGEYEAEIIDSDVEEISKKESKGKCLRLTWKVLNGEYAGRQVWQRLNLWFEGAEKTPGKVVQIANGQFATVREATGVAAPVNSAELHNRPCVIRVSWEQDQGYAPKNEVKHVKAIGGQPTFSNAPAQAPASQQRQAPASSAPANAQAPRKAPWPSKAA